MESCGSLRRSLVLSAVGHLAFRTLQRRGLRPPQRQRQQSGEGDPPQKQLRTGRWTVIPVIILGDLGYLGIAGVEKLHVNLDNEAHWLAS